MYMLNSRRIRTLGMRPAVWLAVGSCLILLPAIFAQTNSGKIVRAASNQINLPANIMEGMLVEKTAPVYPPIAKAARVSGTVVLQAAISKTGTIEGLRVLSGPAMLQQAAFDAVKTWRYQPFLLEGRPVRVLTTINVVFSLSSADVPLKAAASSSGATGAQGDSHPDAAQTVAPPASSLSPIHNGMSEFAAWLAASKDGTPEVYWDFYEKFPNSNYIKTAEGTLRGRYWFKVAQPFGDDGKHRDGVIVTVDGMNVAVNLTLDKAKQMKVIGFTPSSDTADSDSSGRTFNHTYFEATRGGVLVGDQMITPKDLLKTTLILSADGSRLLSWDTSSATVADQPSGEPTMIQDANGKFACGDACPTPADY